MRAVTAFMLVCAALCTQHKIMLTLTAHPLPRHHHSQVWQMAIALYLVGTVVWNAFSTGAFLLAFHGGHVHLCLCAACVLC